MIEGVLLTACPKCSWQGMPHRSWCPRCGSFELRTIKVSAGVLAETTVVRRIPRDRATDEWADEIELGAVHADGGGTIIARLARGANEADRVALFEDDGVAVALPTTEVDA